MLIHTQKISLFLITLIEWGIRSTTRKERNNSLGACEGGVEIPSVDFDCISLLGTNHCTATCFARFEMNESHGYIFFFVASPAVMCVLLSSPLHSNFATHTSDIS